MTSNLIIKVDDEPVYIWQGYKDNDHCCTCDGTKECAEGIKCDKKIGCTEYIISNGEGGYIRPLKRIQPKK